MKRNLFVTGLSLFALAVSLGSARAATTDLSISPTSGAAAYPGGGGPASLPTFWIFTVTFTDPASTWDYTMFTYNNAGGSGGAYGDGSSGGMYSPSKTHGGSSSKVEFDLVAGVFACSSDNYITDPNGQHLHYGNGPITVTVTHPTHM